LQEDVLGEIFALRWSDVDLDEHPVVHVRGSLQRVHGRLQIVAKKDGEGVLLTVADNGPGIPEEYHELIFRKFERVKNPSIPRTRSSGLGLAFCKLVVDALSDQGVLPGWTPSVESGVERLRRRARPGDVLLLLGAGDIDRAVGLLGAV